ncbi:MAG: (d)CMP kinase [Thermodesulfobacterium geofontis]|uniref:Cytidylate kinase n=1 Tax=Thermodesulfobacterium geofontis TaxID=1295609 RepID=A0A2N7PP82_9BACT|nr:MAG: (d)CMP kinase [Thermodesulfobacterium geofontis]
MKKFKIITIDGPASSGKTTLAKMIAQKLNIPLLESGALYRLVTYLLIKSGKIVKANIENKEILIKFLKEIFKEIKIELTPVGTNIYWNGKLIKEELKEKEVESTVSQVSAIKEVREFLTELMRGLAKDKSLVSEGRDMGSFVFPYADIKIFLTADEKIRVQRRFKEKLERENYKGKDLYEDVLNNIKLRDELDSQREVAPLIIPEGAYVIDTSYLTPEEVSNEILKIIK